jgi:hypothetical protein
MSQNMHIERGVSVHGEKMKYQSIFAFIVSATVSAPVCADDLVKKAEQILSTSPEQAVQVAIEHKDYQFLHTPVCAEGMPGFDFTSYRGDKPTPKEIWSNCEDLMGKERYQLLIKMEQWVTEYNQLMTATIVNTSKH